MASIFAHTCFRRMLGYNSGLNSSTPCFFRSVACMCWLLGPYFFGRWMCGYRCCNGVILSGFWGSCVFCPCPIISDHRYCSILVREKKNLLLSFSCPRDVFEPKSKIHKFIGLQRKPEWCKNVCVFFQRFPSQRTMCAMSFLSLNLLACVPVLIFRASVMVS